MTTFLTVIMVVLTVVLAISAIYYLSERCWSAGIISVLGFLGTVAGGFAVVNHNDSVNVAAIEESLPVIKKTDQSGNSTIVQLYAVPQGDYYEFTGEMYSVQYRKKDGWDLTLMLSSEEGEGTKKYDGIITIHGFTHAPDTEKYRVLVIKNGH